jgi:hypothetical protein
MFLRFNARMNWAKETLVKALFFCTFFATTGHAAPLLYANVNGQFVSFRADSPGTIIRTFSVSGLSGELRAMDFRLTTGRLYALYSDGSDGGHRLLCDSPH